LKAKLEADFHTDNPSFTVNITFDASFTLDTYDPEGVIAALTTGGYDMFEVDTIILGVLINASAIRPIPDDVDFTGFSDNAVHMVEGFRQPNGHHKKYGVPTYSCSNIFYSYDSSLRDNNNIFDLLDWIHHRSGRHGTAVLGWTTDISNLLDLRLEYLDSWLDSHPTTPFFPEGYGLKLDTNIVGYIESLRDTCTDKTVTPHVNHCTDGVYYNDFPTWFADFVSGHSLLLQGFPEYFSSIIEADPANSPTVTRTPTDWSAVLGDGSLPYMFTDAFTISKNCQNPDEEGFNCLDAAVAWLNWSKTHYAETASLGLDLTPVRPRYLGVSYEPFYTSIPSSVPTYGQDHYAFCHSETARSAPLDTLHFWTNEDSQSNKLAQRVLDGFTP